MTVCTIRKPARRPSTDSGVVKRATSKRPAPAPRSRRAKTRQSLLPSSSSIQAKLRINEPNDRFEREADSVADRVMRMPETQLRRREDEREEKPAPLQRQEQEEGDEEAQTFSLQRQEEEGEEEAQTFSLQRQEHEEEGQEEVQAFSLQRQEEESEEEAQTSPLQRQEQEEGEEEVQTKAGARSRRRVTASFQARLRALKTGGGRQLDRPLLRFMEGRFGRGFSDVRIHVGPAAARLAKHANAKAFTVGKHLVFGSGEYRPNADQGRRLIAHELTHVLQQRGGLHSVQRELFQPEPKPDDQSEDRFLAEIRRLMGMEEGALPAAIQSITSELLLTALRGPDGELLHALTAEHAAAEATSRLIESSQYSLSLSIVRTNQSARAVWELTRAGEERPFFGHAQTTTANSGIPEGGVDEQTVRVATPTPPRFASDPAISPARVVAGPSEVLELVSTPASTQTPEPAPPRSEALEEADAAAAVEPPSPRSEGRGDAAGSDSPTQPRPAVDVEAEDEVPEEVSPPEPALEVRRKAAPNVLLRPGPTAERRVRKILTSPGAPLSANLRGAMEARFGVDFSLVRLHQDREAADAARSLGAKAFTVGRHVVFGAGQFQPTADCGRRLLAHELAHVVQQREGRSPVDLVQRQEEECPPPEPVPEVEVIPSPAGPNEDPAFSKMEKRAENRANNQAAHGHGEEKSASANAAAEVKEGEKKSHAQKDQVGDMAAKAESPPAFDKQGFISSVLKEVEKIAPETLDDVMKFSDRGKAGQIKGAVQGEVSNSSEATQGPIKESATADPGPGESPRTSSALDVEPPGPQPGSVRADRAMPPPKTASEMDLRADTVRADNILKEACVTREYMDKHDDPELMAGAASQDELHEATEKGPERFREGEAAELRSSRAGASSAGVKGVAEMFGARSGQFADVGKSQQQTKTDNEKKREAAANEINTIFTNTQTKVKNRLEKLDKDVNDTFDRETKAATDKFESFIRRNAEKYENNWFEDAIDFFSDLLFDPPPKEVRDFYRQGRVAFLKDMEGVIGKVADLVDTGLKDARKLVDEGKRQVTEKLDSLGSGLEDFKQQISEQMNDKFRKLEGDIDAKQGEIVKGLAQRYVKAFEKVKAIENQVREEYKSVFDRAKEALESVVDFVVGWAEKLAAVVGGAATRIIRDPLKFLRNLGAGIVQGLETFISEVGANIKAAVVEWLTGNMAGGGIQLPTTFDVKGIIGFLLDLVGLGVAGIKEIARKVLGRQAVSLIEQGAEGFEKVKQIFDVLASEGPSGLFKFLQSEFAKMKDQVMAEVGKALAEGLVIAGIKRVLGIISGLVSGGVGTVITIVLTIIDVILWFRDNAAQIAELVSTIASMAMAVLEGKVAALANAVNSVLKRILPLVLGFVGALVGIGGVVRKIQKIFKAIGKPARKAIRKLFLKFKKLIQKLLKKSKKKGKKGKGKLSKQKVRKLIIREMEKPTKAKDPAKAIEEVKRRVSGLKSKYQPELKQGNIKIKVLDSSPASVTKDSNVDASVSLSEPTRTETPVAGLPLRDTVIKRTGSGAEAFPLTTKGRDGNRSHDALPFPFDSATKVASKRALRMREHRKRKAKGSTTFVPRATGTTSAKFYERTHLVAEELGGRIDAWNLKITTNSVNSRMRAPERKALGEITKKAAHNEQITKTLKYTVSVGPPPPSRSSSATEPAADSPNRVLWDAEEGLISSISVNIKEMKETGEGRWEEAGNVGSFGPFKNKLSKTELPPADAE